MPDYNQLLDDCRKESNILRTVIEEFLLYYAARRDKLDREFETKLSRYKDTVREMPSNWKGLTKAQYIAFRLFRKDGLINKYLNYSAIKELGQDEQAFLRKMAQHPWRFSFGEIIANPAPDFYEMEDVFTGDVYLLYSAAMSQTLSQHPVSIWFNLIGFNGSCWQTYGPIIDFKGFSPDDIFFYATEANQDIESDADLAEDIDENPIRYMLLAAGSNFPLMQSRGHEVVQVKGEGHATDFDLQLLRNEFKVEYAESIFKLTHPAWSEPPHLAEVFYEEESGRVFLSALTDRGYTEMSAILNRNGINIPQDPDIRVHLTMLNVIDRLLKKRLDLNPYSRLFETRTSPESDEQMARLNHFMALALPYVNAGKKPDLDALAEEAGVDPDTAKELFGHAMKQIRDMRK